MDSVSCEYCGQAFNRLSNMYKHQRTAEYCLELQGKTKEGIQCTYCSKSFSRLDTLSRHEKKCNDKPLVSTPEKQPTPEESKPVDDPKLLAMLIQLKNVMESISGPPKRPVDPDNINNIRNMTLQNLTPLTDADLTQHLANLSLEYIVKGGIGYAIYANYNSLNGKVICTDRARKKMKYKDPNGQIVDDAYGVKLTKRFFQAIAPRNEELINNEYNDLQQQVDAIAANGIIMESNLTTVLTRATKLQEILASCKEAEQGEINDMTRAFINHLSKNL